MDSTSTMAASKAFDNILECVKSSNLNFCLQLSPFSATISLKKTLVKDKAGLYLYPLDTNSSAFPKEDLDTKIKQLEKIVTDLKSSLAESVSEREQAYTTITELKNKLKIKQEIVGTKENDLKNKLEKKTCEISILNDEKKQLQYQLHKKQALIMERDSKIQNLQQSLKTSNCTVSTLNKKLVEIRVTHEDEKKLVSKNFKSEIKSWKKDLGAERSEKLKTKNKLDALENRFKQLYDKRKSSISCQTNQSPDLPYLVTEPLPPIFGSQLVQKSKIQHMTRSMPDLATVNWIEVTEEDSILEAAEEALNEQYDRQVERFYKDAKAKTAALREVFDENCIWKLFNDAN